MKATILVMLPIRTLVVKVLSTVILFMYSLILFHQQVNDMCIYELPNLYTRLSSLDIEPASQIAN